MTLVLVPGLGVSRTVSQQLRPALGPPTYARRPLSPTALATLSFTLLLNGTIPAGPQRWPFPAAVPMEGICTESLQISTLVLSFTPRCASGTFPHRHRQREGMRRT